MENNTNTLHFSEIPLVTPYVDDLTYISDYYIYNQDKIDRNKVYIGNTVEAIYRDNDNEALEGYLLSILVKEPEPTGQNRGLRTLVFLPTTQKDHFPTYSIICNTNDITRRVRTKKDYGNINVLEVTFASEYVKPSQYLEELKQQNSKKLETYNNDGVICKLVKRTKETYTDLSPTILPTNHRGYILQIPLSRRRHTLVFLSTSKRKEFEEAEKVKIRVTFDKDNIIKLPAAQQSNVNGLDEEKEKEYFKAKELLSFEVMKEIFQYKKDESWDTLIPSVRSNDQFVPAIPEPKTFINYLRKQHFLHPTQAQQFIIEKSKREKNTTSSTLSSSKPQQISFSDMVVKAAPGSGKTLGFLISALKRINLKDQFDRVIPSNCSEDKWNKMSSEKKINYRNKEWQRMNLENKSKYLNDITSERQKAFQVLIIVNTKTLVTQHGNILKTLIQENCINKDLRVELIGDDTEHEKEGNGEYGTNVTIITHDKHEKFKQADHEIEKRWQNRVYEENGKQKFAAAKADFLQNAKEAPNPEYPHIVITTPIKASHFVCERIFEDPNATDDDKYVIFNDVKMRIEKQEENHENQLGRAFLPTKNLKMMILDEADSIMKNEDFYRAFFNEKKYSIGTKIYKNKDTNERVKMPIYLKYGIKKTLETTTNNKCSIMALSGTFSDENVLGQESSFKKKPAQACADLKADGMPLYELPIRYEHVKQFNYVLDVNEDDENLLFKTKCDKAIELCEIFSKDLDGVGNNQILIFVKSALEQQIFFNYVKDKRRLEVDGSDVYWDFTIDPELFKPPAIEQVEEEYVVEEKCESEDEDRNENDKTKKQFRIKQVQKPAKRRICIATNKMAQGIDIKTIRLVIQLDPTSGSEYIQKVYRTGRDGQNGASVLFVTKNQNEFDSDRPFFQFYHSTATLRKVYGQEIEDLPSCSDGSTSSNAYLETFALKGKSCKETFNISSFKECNRDSQGRLQFSNTLKDLTSNLFDYIEDEDEKKQTRTDLFFLINDNRWDRAIKLVESKSDPKDEAMSSFNSFLEKRQTQYKKDRDQKEEERDRRLQKEEENEKQTEIDYIRTHGYETFIQDYVRNKEFEKCFNKVRAGLKGLNLNISTLKNELNSRPSNHPSLSVETSRLSTEEGTEELKMRPVHEEVHEEVKELLHLLLGYQTLDPLPGEIQKETDKKKQDVDKNSGELNEATDSNILNVTGDSTLPNGQPEPELSSISNSTINETASSTANNTIVNDDDKKTWIIKMMKKALERNEHLEKIEEYISLEVDEDDEYLRNVITDDLRKRNLLAHDGTAKISNIIETVKNKKIKRGLIQKFETLLKKRKATLEEEKKRKEEEIEKQKKQIVYKTLFKDDLEEDLKGEDLRRLLENLPSLHSELNQSSSSDNHKIILQCLTQQVLKIEDSLTEDFILASKCTFDWMKCNSFILQCLIQRVLNIEDSLTEDFILASECTFDWMNEDKYGPLLLALFNNEFCPKETENTFCNRKININYLLLSVFFSGTGKKIPRMINGFTGFESANLPDSSIRSYKGIGTEDKLYPSGLISESITDELILKNDSINLFLYHEQFAVTFMKALLWKNIIDESTLQNFVEDNIATIKAIQTFPLN